MEFVVAIIIENPGEKKSWLNILSISTDGQDMDQEPITAHAIENYATKYDAVFAANPNFGLSFHNGQFLTNGWLWMERVNSSDVESIKRILFSDYEYPEIYRVIEKRFVQSKMILAAAEYYTGETK